VTSYLGASTEQLAAVESHAAMTTGDVNFDDVPFREAYFVVGSYHCCPRAAVIAVCMQQQGIYSLSSIVTRHHIRPIGLLRSTQWVFQAVTIQQK